MKSETSLKLILYFGSIKCFKKIPKKIAKTDTEIWHFTLSPKHQILKKKSKLDLLFSDTAIHRDY